MIDDPSGSHDPLQQLSLCEALDRILHKGAVVVGEVRLSVADVDLLYVGLQLVVSSIDTLRESDGGNPDKTQAPSERLTLGLGLGAGINAQSADGVDGDQPAVDPSPDDGQN